MSIQGSTEARATRASIYFIDRDPPRDPVPSN
jgi:hypothetical protein